MDDIIRLPRTAEAPFLISLVAREHAYPLFFMWEGSINLCLCSGDEELKSMISTNATHI